MQKVRSRLMLALLFTGLFLLAFVGTSVVSFPVWFRFRNVTALATLRGGAQIAAIVAAGGFFVAAAIVAVAVALQPASWLHKLFYVLPVYLLGLTLTGALLGLLGIGTVGPFITVWLAGGGVLSMVAVVSAAARGNLSQQTQKAALAVLGITAVPSLLAWLAMVISIILVLTSQPSSLPRGFNNRPDAPAVAGTPVTPGSPARQAAPEFGREGAGRFTTSLTPLVIGGVAMTFFATLQILATVGGWRILRRTRNNVNVEAPQKATLNYGREIGQAVVSGVAITVAVLAASQLFPVVHSNPPPQTTVQWDSPQTANLAQRACMDCHSDQTTWPWYSYIAPGSWLTISHVNSGRQRLNLSELNHMPAFRKTELLNEIAQQIRGGAMPPQDYLILHPEAHLSNPEKEQLIQGLQQSLANSLASR